MRSWRFVDIKSQAISVLYEFMCHMFPPYATGLFDSTKKSCRKIWWTGKRDRIFGTENFLAKHQIHFSMKRIFKIEDLGVLMPIKNEEAQFLCGGTRDGGPEQSQTIGDSSMSSSSDSDSNDKDSDGPPEQQGGGPEWV